jgi:hypothetical protein
VSREVAIADNEVVSTSKLEDDDSRSSDAAATAAALVTSGPPTDKAAVLLALHTGPGFVLPNAWDAGSARILEQVGFPAIATTSAGIAWSCGVPDGEVLDRDTMLEHVGRVVAAVGVPVTADLEAGWGDTAADVGLTVARAVGLGAVGGNPEDAGPDGLFGIDEAVDRLAAARAEAPRATFVLNARTDTYFGGSTGDPYAETVERAIRYLEAGADCIFVPGRGGGHDPPAHRGGPGPAQRGGGVGEHHRRPDALLARRQASQPGRQPGPSHAEHGGARRPVAARLRHARLPRRRHRVRRPAGTLRLVIASVSARFRPV